MRLFTLHTLLNAIICCLQLNTHGRPGSYLLSGLWVIDAASKQSMYILVMPNRSNNEHVLIIYCIVMRLHFVNCPAVICLPNMYAYLSYGDKPLVNCGPRSFIPHWYKYRFHHALRLFPAVPFCTHHHISHHTFNPLYSASRGDWQPSCFVGAKYFDCVVCRSTSIIVNGAADTVLKLFQLLLVQ